MFRKNTASCGTEFIRMAKQSKQINRRRRKAEQHRNSSRWIGGNYALVVRGWWGLVIIISGHQPGVVLGGQIGAFNLRNGERVVSGRTRGESEDRIIRGSRD